LQSKFFDLSGKVAIVTGASAGLGKAMAVGLAGAGAKVAICARTLEKIEAAAREIRDATGSEVLPLSVDVRDVKQIDEMVRKTEEKFGRIDILVNNAGGHFEKAPLELSDRGWNSIMTENLTSVFLFSQAAAKVMKVQKGGSIINNTSVAGLRSYVINASYGAAKAGIINLTKTLAAALAPHNVRVNAIAPGLMGTDAVMPFYNSRPDMLAKVPMGRYGDPEEVVGATVFLASDASTYVTGTTIVIDGGLTCSLF
jgi:NAD(P)-dependent dehydrogenase (short-subunit alcohol dehydrogenase family)